MTPSPSSGHNNLTFRLTACLAGVFCFLLAGVLILPSLPGYEQSAVADGSLWAGQQRAIDRQPARPAHFDDAVRAEFNLHGGEVVPLDLPASGEYPAVFQMQLPLPDQLVTLDLHTFSNWAEDSRVWHQIDDGSLVEVDPGPISTYRGFVREMPGSIVAAGLIDGTMHGMVELPDGTRYIIESLKQRIPGALDTEHVVYDMRDADCDDSRCGVPDHWQAPPIDPQPQTNAEGGLAGNDCQQVLIAIDADFPFFNIHGSNTLNRVLAVMNNTNTIYENEVGIRHWVSEVIIRTSADANPYSGSVNGNQCPAGSGSASNLLSQLRTVWATSPELQIQRNIAHLFTGCTNIDAGGIAWLGTMCQSAFGNPYSLAAHTSSLGCATHVTTHELGHNWGAPHCSGCSGTIMHPTFPPCVTTFAQSSKNTINNYKNSPSGSCTTTCGPPQPQPPSNNSCTSSLIAGEGLHPFSNELATTTGPDEPDLCDFNGDTQVQSDIWYRHTAACNGQLTVSLCESVASFDTKLAVYLSSTCPSLDGTAAACNKDSCGNLSSVTVPVTTGQTVRIRIGGHNDQQGEGVLEIVCESDVPVNPCPPDINGDGTVDGFDLLLLLGNWGPVEPGNAADINGSGEVDGFDLLLLLGNWGDCPD